MTSSLGFFWWAGIFSEIWTDHITVNRLSVENLKPSSLLMDGSRSFEISFVTLCEPLVFAKAGKAMWGRSFSLHTFALLCVFDSLRPWTCARYTQSTFGECSGNVLNITMSPLRSHPEWKPRIFQSATKHQEENVACSQNRSRILITQSFDNSKHNRGFIGASYTTYREWKSKYPR